MKRAIVLGLGALLSAGCASLDRMQATQDAVDNGLIDGLSATNQFTAAVWTFPGKPLAQYTKLGGVTAWVTNASGTASTYAFYLGKSRETKKWEVFATTVWRDGRWEPVSVKLPEARR